MSNKYDKTVVKQNESDFIADYLKIFLFCKSDCFCVKLQKLGYKISIYLFALSGCNVTNLTDHINVVSKLG